MLCRSLVNIAPRVAASAAAPATTGSGFVISSDGHIVTNHHVVSSAVGQSGRNTVLVSFQDGRSYEAELVGSDDWCDVAVLKIVKREDEKVPLKPKDGEFVPIKLGSSKELRLGDSMIALGHPLGLKFAANAGILSSNTAQTGDEMSIRRGPLPFVGNGLAYATSLNVTLLQTDAKMVPGNSGGPVINDKGEVVGIATMVMAARTAGSPGLFGLNLCLPIDTALPVIRQLVKTGTVTRNYLGFSVVGLTQSIVYSRKKVDAEFRGKAERGLLVTHVTEGSPGARAGVKKGDVLLSLDGIETNTFGQMFDVLSVYEEGRRISAELLSGGRRKRLKLVPKPLKKAGAGKATLTNGRRQA